jgi:hypothetical protein
VKANVIGASSEPPIDEQLRKHTHWLKDGWHGDGDAIRYTGNPIPRTAYMTERSANDTQSRQHQRLHA